MLSFTRALHRAVRTHRWSGRNSLVLALSAVLAVGTVAAIPVTAHAATPEVRTALHSGVDTSGPFAVFAGSAGYNVALGANHSSNTGAAWTNDPALSTVTWQMAVNNTLVGYKTSGTTNTAVVYTINTGNQATYALPTSPVSMSGSWSLAYNGTYSAYSFVAGGSAVAVPSPTGATVANQSAELTASGAVLWRGNASDGSPAYAVAASPTAPAPTWVSIPGSTGAVASSTQLVYVLATTSTVQICARLLSNLSTVIPCSTVLTGSFDSVYPQFSNFAMWTVINIWTGLGAAGKYTPYIWNGSAPTKVTLPAGSYIDQPAAAGSDIYGDTPFALVRDSSTVPSILRILADGSATTGFPLPTAAAAPVGYLSVAPDRAVGADTRDGALELTSWTRSVSQSGFSGETVLPQRSSGLAASAARTVISGPSGLTVYDRGTVRNTIADAHLSQLSGPYITRLGWNTAANSSQIEVATVNNTVVGDFLGTAGTLFGSEYVTWSTDANQATHVVVNDLTGAAGPRTVTLPSGSATCAAGRVWSNTLVMVCGAKAEAFNLTTGALITTLSAPTNQFVNIMDVGDGYAVVTFNNLDYNLWNTALGTLTPLTDCGYDATSDGVGHVACASSTQLVWRDFSSLSTNGPRLLGVLTSASADFSNVGTTWTLDVDATKPLKAGSVVISKADGTTVRTLATAASSDGSIRAVTWDGLDSSGKSLSAGRYTYKVVVDAADGSGALTSVDGTGPVTGTVTITSASPVGMSAGALLPVVPSRLLDTRITGPSLGSNQTRTLKVTGVGGVPATGVSAVVLNVTITDATSGGYLTVSPTGSTRPVVSNLNWSPGITIPNAVTVKVGTNGQVDLYQLSQGSISVVVDVAGYYIDGNVTAAGGFTALSPARILDSRITGGKFASGETRDLTILGASGVPAANVSAVVLNVTVTDTSAGGYLTVYPSGGTRPVASNLNWSPGQTIPNLVTVQVGGNGKISIYQSAPGAISVVVDVAGYYLGGTPTQAGMFVALTPARLLDTRTTNSPIAGLSDRALTILGQDQGKIPASGVSAVVINTTVTDTHTPGFLTVYPGTSSLPLASNLNWSGPNITIPNLVTVQLGSDGSIKFHNGTNTTIDVVVDVAGYYIGT